MRVRLALLLLMAGMLLPRAAEAQAMREFGAFAGAENPGYPAPEAPGSNFAGSNSVGGNFVVGMGGALSGNPQQASSFGGAPLGGSNGGSAMQPNFGWNTDPPDHTGAARFGLRQAFGVASDRVATQSETAQATFLAMTQFTQTLLDPAIDGRGSGQAEFDAELSAYAATSNDLTHGGIGREAYTAIYGKPSLAVAHWGVWAAGFGGSQSSSLGNGSSTRSFATVVGADYALSPQTRMGFALAGGGTGFANNFSSGRSDLFQAGAFVRHTVGAAYVATAAAYGWQAISNDHPVTPAGSDQFAAAVNANAYAGRLESGYRFAMSWLGMTPYAAGQFTMFRLAADAGQPAYASEASTAVSGNNGFIDSRSELGVRVSSSFALWGSVMNLRGRLAWAHDFTATQSTPAVFQAVADRGFMIGSTALAPNSALAGLAIELRNLNGWSAAANFDSELSSLVRSYTGKAVLRYAW